MNPAIPAVAAAVLVATAAVAQVPFGVKVACTPDAIRLCATDMPKGRDAVTGCMKQHWDSVGADCKNTVSKQMPAVEYNRPPKPVAVIMHPKSAKVAEKVKLPKVHLPSVNPPEVISAPSEVEVVAPPASEVSTHQENKMDWFSLGWQAAGLFGMFMFVVYGYKYGVKPVASAVFGTFAVAKADLAALEARVKLLEGGAKPAAPVPPAASPAA